MSYRVKSVPTHGDKGASWLRRTRAAYVQMRGEEAAVQRAAEIAALPTVQFKGRTLYTIRCCGTTGKGPHDRNVTEPVLWSLISLDYHLCPFHL